MLKKHRENAIRELERLDFEVRDSPHGGCPVQAAGLIGPRNSAGGLHDWYFRARGSGWSLVVNGSDGQGERFEVAGAWGQPYTAGHMDFEDAEELILMALTLYAIQEHQSASDLVSRMGTIRDMMGEGVDDLPPLDASELRNLREGAYLRLHGEDTHHSPSETMELLDRLIAPHLGGTG